MKKFEMKIDSLEYDLIFDENQWSFYFKNSYKNNQKVIKNDLFFDWFSDDSENYYLDDISINTNVFKLAKQIIEKIVIETKKAKPSFFYFSPTTNRKFNIYKRFAKQLEKELVKYELQISDEYFYFTRK